MVTNVYHVCELVSFTFGLFEKFGIAFKTHIREYRHITYSPILRNTCMTFDGQMLPSMSKAFKKDILKILCFDKYFEQAEAEVVPSSSLVEVEVELEVS